MGELLGKSYPTQNLSNASQGFKAESRVKRCEQISLPLGGSLLWCVQTKRLRALIGRQTYKSFAGVRGRLF